MSKPARDRTTPPTPALGLDFGERRIGLAISDREGRMAWPLETLDRETDRRAIYRIADLAKSEGIASLVVGEPKLLDGQVAERAERIRRFARRLAKVVGRPLYLVEETLTTREADERLRSAGRTPAQGDPRRDMVAAQILLEDALAGGGRRVAPDSPDALLEEPA